VPAIGGAAAAAASGDDDASGAPPPAVQGQFDVLGWALEPGDAVAFHMLTLHGSAGTTARRRAFSVRVMGDDTRFAPRKWTTSPEFGAARLAGLAPGGAMGHPLFPVMWPRAPGRG
jgi:hypothetical protein